MSSLTRREGMRVRVRRLVWESKSGPFPPGARNASRGRERGLSPAPGVPPPTLPRWETTTTTEVQGEVRSWGPGAAFPGKLFVLVESFLVVGVGAKMSVARLGKEKVPSVCTRADPSLGVW